MRHLEPSDLTFTELPSDCRFKRDASAATSGLNDPGGSPSLRHTGSPLSPMTHSLPSGPLEGWLVKGEQELRLQASGS